MRISGSVSNSLRPCEMKDLLHGSLLLRIRGVLLSPLGGFEQVGGIQPDLSGIPSGKDRTMSNDHEDFCCMIYAGIALAFVINKIFRTNKIQDPLKHLVLVHVDSCKPKGAPPNATATHPPKK